MATAALWILAVAAKKDREADPRLATVSEPHRVWLEEVDLLITDEEREAFLSLEREYHRNSFILRFWQERDPFPDTRLNEFQENWKLRVQIARDQFGSLEGDRARVLLLIGPPDRVHDSACPQLFQSTVIWEYRGGVRNESYVFFVRGGSRSPDGYRQWSRFEGIETLVPFSARTDFGNFEALEYIMRNCPRGREVGRMVDAALDSQHIDRLAEENPQPSAEWVRGFLGRLTRVPEGAANLSAEFSISFPGRRQSRTVVQALFALAPEVADEAGGRHFIVDGEVLRKDQPFESFRYRFDFSAAESTGTKLPLVVQRFLRPGDYTLIMRLQEIDTERYFRVERQLKVPLLRDPLAGATVAEPGTPTTEEADLYAEANEPTPPLEHRLRILPSKRDLQLGRTRVEAVASGEAVHKVTFALNGRAVMTKLQPPYSVELDLGEAPRLHTLEAIAYDSAGVELARDEADLNSGPHRFNVRLIQPTSGKSYRDSLRIEATVDLPSELQLDRVELYLDEDRLATLYQPPFVQPIRLEPDRGLSYVRAVAFLEDGNSTEDLVFINSPEHLDALEVDFIELYASVTDRAGLPIDDLEMSDFTVLEDGVEQKIRRFERVSELPLHAGVLLDTSTSMENSLGEAERAALRFFQGVVKPRDRAAVIVFNDFPVLTVPLTNNLEVLAGGLAGLEVDGETALYDSLVYGIYYFAGIRGKRALILLSDGADSSSGHQFDETLDFARRSGVAIYTIGLKLDPRDAAARNVLIRFARETGGRSFFVASAGQLEEIYDSIEEELRSQYLIGYQSTHTRDTGFRQVELRVGRSDLEAKTVPGYYP